jgi:hypothetical protein
MRLLAWDLDRENTQPVIEILPEAAVSDHLFEIPVCGGDDAHIGPGLVSTEPIREYHHTPEREEVLPESR